MRVATGAWIPPAFELVAATHDMDPASRRRFLEAQSKAGRGSVNTLHRQMVAAQWLAHRAKVYGVDVKDVSCAYTSVEALAALEGARPDNARKVAESVLLGRLTSRQIMTMVGMTKKSARPDWPNSWEVFLMEEIGPLVPAGAADIAADTATWSAIAKFLKVDVEWRLADGTSVAVFISPALLYAQHKTLYDACLAVTAARSHYDRVVFFTYDEEERVFMEEHAPTAGRTVGVLDVR